MKYLRTIYFFIAGILVVFMFIHLVSGDLVGAVRASLSAGLVFYFAINAE